MEKVRSAFVAMGVAFVVSSLLTLTFNQYGIEVNTFFSLILIVGITVSIIMLLEKVFASSRRSNE